MSVRSVALIPASLFAVIAIVFLATVVAVTGCSNDDVSVSPLGEREGNTLLSFGDEVVLWGGFEIGEDGSRSIQNSGARWDDNWNTWRPMSPSPLSPRWDATGFVHGEEVYFVGGFQATDSAAYAPRTDTWRLLSSEMPLPSNGWDTSTAWTGTQLVYWHSPSDQVWIYAPETDEWTAIDPTGIKVRNLGSLVATDFGVVAVSDRPPTEEPLLDAALLAPGATTWTSLPSVRFSSATGPGLPSSQSVVWAGGLLLAWAASGADSPAFAYNPATNVWEEFAAPGPLRSCEFALTSISVGSTVIALSDCLEAATLNAATLTWAPLEDFPNLLGRPMIEHKGRVVGLSEDSTMWEWTPPVS